MRAGCGRASVQHAVLVAPVRLCKLVQGAPSTQRTRSRRRAPAALFQALQSLAAGKKGRQRLSASRLELMRLVEEGSRDFARARQLVDALIAEQVVFSSGPLLWQAWTAVGDVLTPRRLGRSRNKASQDFDPAERSVINRGDVLGASMYVTASGTYQPLDDNATTPVWIEASIASGCLHVGGREVGLPIRGSGRVSIAYLDASMRIFRDSRGSTTVQVKEAELARELGAAV